MSHMSKKGLRLSILLAGVIGLGGGCRSLAAAPESVHTPPPHVPAERNSPSGVVPASASEPVPVPVTAPVPVATPASPKPDDDSGFDLSDLDPANIYKEIKKTAGFGPDKEIARKLMKEGESLFKEGDALLRRQQKGASVEKFKAAAGKFKSAATRWPDSTLEEDAMFMLGESRFFADQYPDAHDSYGELLEKYKNSRYLDTIMAREFSIGRYWEQVHAKNPLWPVVPNLADGKRPTFDTFGNALEAYQRVRQYDSTGPLADDSIMATANAHFNKGHFEEAAYNYDLLRTEYAASEHQAKAHLLGIQAKMRVYQGADYDAGPLSDAGEIAEQSLAQFHAKLGSERARVVETRNKIVEEKAARDWAMAQYYDNKSCFGAARYYYLAIVKDYPQTQHARRAQKRIEEIKNKPDTPPKRFQWLTNIFPADE